MDRKSMLVSALVIAISVSALSISLISASSNRQVAITGVPTSIAYQGHLQNSDGSPLADEEHELQFTLYADETATEALWTESHAVTTQDGFFSVMLGSKQAFPAGLFGSGALFLGISVDGTEESAPRQQLASVPFAIVASQATTSNGLDCDGCITSEQLADGAVTESKLDEGASVASLTSPNGDYWIEVTDEGIVFHGNGTTPVGKTVTFAFNGKWQITANDNMQLGVDPMLPNALLTLSGFNVNVDAQQFINMKSGHQVNVDGQNGVSITTNGSGSFEAGATMSVTADGQLDLAGNGSASLDGAIVQLGGGCMPVARVGDPVTTTGTMGAATGTITSGSATVLAC